MSQKIKIRQEALTTRTAKYDYVRNSDSTLWSVSRIDYDVVYLWTINANDRTYRTSCKRSDFFDNYRENTDPHLGNLSDAFNELRDK